MGDDSSEANDKLPKKFSGLCTLAIFNIFQINFQLLINNNLFFAAVGGMASSQLSQINSVTAQSGGRDVDEFDMLAQSRNDAKT